MKWRLSLRAKADLRRVVHRITRDNPRAAEAWLARVLDRAKLAGRSPGLGRKVPELDREDLREAIVGNYRLVYCIRGKLVVILTVFEGHQLPRDLEPELE